MLPGAETGASPPGGASESPGESGEQRAPQAPGRPRESGFRGPGGAAPALFRVGRGLSPQVSGASRASSPQSWDREEQRARTSALGGPAL